MEVRKGGVDCVREVSVTCMVLEGRYIGLKKLRGVMLLLFVFEGPNPRPPPLLPMLEGSS